MYYLNGIGPGGPDDEAGFEAAMAEQRERARASAATSEAVFAGNAATALAAAGVPETVFSGYDTLQTQTTVLAILRGGQDLVAAAEGGQDVVVVVADTPFYAMGGGQVGDRGTLRLEGCEVAIHNTTRQGVFHLHQATVQRGTLTQGAQAELAVDEDARRATERHHTATHLLHAALKLEVGSHINQAGSEVGPDRLRFDFTHGEKLTREQIYAVEDAVNAQVMLAQPVCAKVQSMDEARASGFIALFGEKYGDEVRSLSVGDYSKELCGGTHVANSGAIGGFRIVSEAAISAGTRRIEAVAGDAACRLARSEQAALQDLSQTLKAPAEELPAKISNMVSEAKKLRKQLDQALAADLTEVLADLERVASATEHGKAAVLEVKGLNMKDLQDLMARAQQSMAPFAGVILAPGEDGVLVGATVSKGLTGRVKAGDLVGTLTRLMGGGGGGRPEAAQGKGRDPSKLPDAQAKATEMLKEAGLI